MYHENKLYLKKFSVTLAFIFIFNCHSTEEVIQFFLNINQSLQVKLSKFVNGFLSAPFNSYAITKQCIMADSMNSMTYITKLSEIEVVYLGQVMSFREVYYLKITEKLTYQ